MRGSITKRGKNSWRLKFDLGIDPTTKKRKTAYHTFRGTRRQAESKLAELITAVDKSEYVGPSKITVAEFVPARIDYWEASGEISARTAGRYRELVEHQIAPYLGEIPLQKLRPHEIENWYTRLRTSGRADGKAGLAPRTIGHAHRVLGKALNDAVRLEVAVKNVLADLTPPKVNDEEMVIVQDIPAFIALVRGHHMFTPAMLSLFTGMRLGEVLGLRWSRIDLARKVIEVREAIEETKKHGIRLKPPKTKAGRRDISLPDILVEVLRAFRKEQLELRVKLGVGKLPDDALLFAGPNGELPSPKHFSKTWSRCADQIRMPKISFHCLRHTHTSQLIDANVDIVTISKRLGHAKPDITLRVYSHLFKKDDSKAAAAINTALSR
jgi:integrase